MMFLCAFLQLPVQVRRNVLQSDGRHCGTVTVPFWLSTQGEDYDWLSVTNCSRLSAASTRDSLRAVVQPTPGAKVFQLEAERLCSAG
jgi:hypothetical protein